MPKKIRELKSILRRAGCQVRSGKGSHTVWTHQLVSESITISGNDGDDAKPYQERDVQEFMQKIEDKS